MGDLKTIIITGANSGLGFETAKKIAKNQNYQIILACRNKEKAEKAREDIIKETSNQNVKVMILDTSSLKSVRSFVEEYKESNIGKIYALICNSGINGSNTGLTFDGFDIVFETNHLGHFLLANLLLPFIEENGKVFVVSSDMHNPPMGNLKWIGTEKLAHPDNTLASNTIRYSYSKLCNLYFVYELARRLEQESKQIFVNAFNPGLMQTNFQNINFLSIQYVKHMMPERLGDLDKSSKALAELIVNDDLVKKSGQYYDRSINTCDSSDLSYNIDNAKELWDKSEFYTNNL